MGAKDEGTNNDNDAWENKAQTKDKKKNATKHKVNTTC